MWFIGLVIGALMGGAIGSLLHWDEAWLVFAALGAVGGVLYKERRGNAPVLEQRLAALEREVRELKARGAAADGSRVGEAAVQPGPASASAAAAGSPLARPLMPEAASAAGETPALQARATAHFPAERGMPKQPAAQVSQASRLQQEPGWLYQKLFGGNILAKIGVVLLLIGVGSGLKLAIDFGMFPAPVRLLLATVAGIGMIGFGYSRVRTATHRMFGLALQGGGFGVLYLVTYFAFARYGYLAPAAAFALFAGLGIACLATAWRFEGEPLAILGISGAFMAPLLASTGSGSYMVLFSYYAVLDAMVVAVTVVRAWRVLTLIALGFTMLTGAIWAGARFTPSAYAHAQGFLLLFFAIFSLAPAVRALLGRVSSPHWADVVLLFGTPIAAATAQSWLIDRMGYPDVVLAWSALGAGVYYSALAALLFVRKAPEALRIAHSAIAIGFYTLAVPLAFGAPVTSAFWAIEGLALAWFGMSQRRGLPYAAGLVLQLTSGVYFLREWEGGRTAPVLNPFYVGCIVIFLCGAWTAWLSKRTAAADWLGRENAKVFPSIAGAWALAWWLAANFSEIARFAPRAHESALYIGVLIVTAWALMAIGRALPSTITRYVALALASLAILGVLLDGWGRLAAHPLHDSMAFALPAGFATVYAILRRNERDGLTGALPVAHVYAVLMLGILLLRETHWIAAQLAPGVRLWTLLAWLVVPAALACCIAYLGRAGAWPVSTQRTAYLAVAAPVLLAVAALAALHANLNHGGSAPGLPYLPVASFFDAAQIAVILAVVAWARAAQPPLQSGAAEAVRGSAAGLAFVWLSGMAMRIAHHWSGVPFEARALFASGVAQSMLSLLWTALALTLMINATRRVMRRRWFLGFALLGLVGAKFILIDVGNKGTVTWTLSLIGVGLLILAASYFSPAPPRAR